MHEKLSKKLANICGKFCRDNFELFIFDSYGTQIHTKGDQSLSE